jgi:hypothetical protein
MNLNGDEQGSIQHYVRVLRTSDLTLQYNSRELYYEWYCSYSNQNATFKQHVYYS